MPSSSTRADRVAPKFRTAPAIRVTIVSPSEARQGPNAMADSQSEPPVNDGSASLPFAIRRPDLYEGSINFCLASGVVSALICAAAFEGFLLAGFTVGCLAAYGICAAAIWMDRDYLDMEPDAEGTASL